MGANAISFTALLLFVILAVFTQARSPTVVKKSSGGSATLPCDGAAYRGLPDSQLNIQWQTFEGKLVAQYYQGKLITGSHFDKRVTFFQEKIGDGNFSLTINPLKLSDDGNYECMWGRGQSDERFLTDVRLQVLEPPVPNSLSVHAGESVTLPCFRFIHKWASEPLSVVWKREEEPVIELRSEEITYGKMYEGRASVSPSLIQEGDLSLTINNTRLCDAGEYTCVSGPKQKKTSIMLEVKGHGRFIPVSVSLGKPFSISLPSGPVWVSLSRNGTFPGVSLCFSDTCGHTRHPKYLHRMKWESGYLTILNVTSEDVGTYTVIHTENCVISHTYFLSIKPSSDGKRKYFVSGIVCALIILLILCAVVCVLLYKQKQKYSEIDNGSLKRVSIDSQEEPGL